MRAAYFCLIVAAGAALIGMALGIYMGMAQDLTLAPAHAHLNLLGWVTMALYGLYHSIRPQSDPRLAWTQVGLGAVGFALMSGGLGAYLATQDDGFAGLVIAGALTSVAGMALFLALVIADSRRAAPPSRRAEGRLTFGAAHHSCDVASRRLGPSRSRKLSSTAA